MHTPESVQENVIHKFLLEFEIQANHIILTMKLDLLIKKKKTKSAIPLSVRVLSLDQIDLCDNYSYWLALCAKIDTLKKQWHKNVNMNIVSLKKYLFFWSRLINFMSQANPITQKSLPFL